MHNERNSPESGWKVTVYRYSVPRAYGDRARTTTGHVNKQPDTRRIPTLLALLPALLLGLRLCAQDPVFTQFSSNPLHLNPAFTGDHCWRVVMNSRTQWSQLSGRYQTSAMSVDHGFRNWGVGIQAMYDGGAAYTFRDLTISGLLSYRTRLGRSLWTSMGFRFNYQQRVIDPNKLQFRDQIETHDGMGFIYRSGEDIFTTRLNGTDLGAGLLLYSSSWSVGISGDHLADRSDGYDSFTGGRWWIPRRLTGHAALFFPIHGFGKNSRWPVLTLSPEVHVSWQAGYWERNLALRINRGPAVLGAGYRFNNAITVLAGYETGRMALGLSTDITTARTLTDLPYNHQGAPQGVVQPFTIELAVQWRMRCETSATRRKGIPCPDLTGKHLWPLGRGDKKSDGATPAPGGGSRFEDNVVPDRPR